MDFSTDHIQKMGEMVLVPGTKMMVDAIALKYNIN